jgi:hypothetical protein
MIQNGLKEFGDITKKLSVNPLGIIALFIVLIYGIAAMVLGFSSNNFMPGERLPLIWFLVVFPPVVLFSFTWLVANHHTKLYAPKDFPDPSQFLQALNPDQQRQKLESEVRLLEGEKLRASNEKSEIEAEKVPSIADTPRNMLMARVLLAEDLVLRELSSEYGVDIKRQMGLGRDIGIDGMFAKSGEGFGIEVKFFRTQKNVRNIVESLRRVRDHLGRLGWKRFNFILAAVIDDTGTQDVDRVKKCIQKAVDDLETEIEIRYFIFSELTAKYGATLPTNG